jgi:hypothetical protein
MSTGETKLIRVTVKSFAGDFLSIDCSQDDSLLQLKRHIASAAAAQLGLEWPVPLQQLIPWSTVDNGDGEIGGDDEKQAGTSSFSHAGPDSMSLQSLNIRDGYVLAVFVENQVRFKK